VVVSIRCREMGTAEHHGHPLDEPGPAVGVSIRCREMGTAKHY